jgi:hypothetical protein
MICPNAMQIRKALAVAYCYQRLKVSGTERFAEMPLKDEHSHIADALQYALLGAGEGHLPRHVDVKREAYSLM